MHINGWCFLHVSLALFGAPIACLAGCLYLPLSRLLCFSIMQLPLQMESQLTAF
jgi:hypothetical protein